MSSPKRDVPHSSPTIRGCTARPGLLVKSCDRRNSVRSPSMVSLPLLGPAESAGRPLRARPTPAFLQGPPPGRPLSPARPSSVLPALSAAELPRLVAEVGPGVAAGDRLWTGGPRLMASALGVHIPLGASRLSCEEEPTLESVTAEEEEKPTAILRTVRKPELRLEPLTGMEVAEIFMRKRLLGKAQIVHLKTVEGEAFRPYDLHAVPHDQAGSEHFIFSSSSVLHIRDGTGGVGFQTLGDWHREALQWTLLQGLPFFRNFRLRRAFTWWHRNVRRSVLLRARGLLQEKLLIAVPQFREALLQVSRLIAELKQVHWLPQDDSRTYTLEQFHSTVARRNEESRALLGKFLQYRSLILNMVQEDSYRTRQELQEQLERAERAQPPRPGQPLHLQQVRRRSMRRDLDRAESAVKRLANMAALVDHMTVQSLATVVRREVEAFLGNVVTRSSLQQGLFLTELVFGMEGQLALIPPVHLLQEALQGAMCSVADSVLQVINSNLSSESKDWVAGGTPLTDATRDVTPDPGIPTNDTAEPWGANGELLMQRPVSPSKLALPNSATPRVEGHRVRGHCYPLPCPSLLWQLSASVGQLEAQRELARITQETVQEVQQLCDGFSWLGDVWQSCSRGSSAGGKVMRERDSRCYRGHVQRLQGWAERLRTLPECFTTSNRLVTVRCSHIRKEIGPQLASMEEEVLAHLQEELQQRSEDMVSQLKTLADWLRAEPTDFEGFSLYASRVKQCDRLIADLQNQGQSLQSLRETLCLSSRSPGPDAAVLEAQVQEGWNHFLPLLQRAKEVVRQHTPSMTAILDRTVSSLTEELQGLVSGASSGPYVDPAQDSATMVAHLQSMHGQFCAVAAQLEQMTEASGVIGNGEKPMDISFVAEGRRELEDRKALWELLRVSASYIHEWRQLPFSKFVVPRSQEKVDRWLQQAALLERTVHTGDMVLKHVLQLLEGFKQQLPLLAELSNPTLRHKHWQNVFKGMELGYTPEKDMTVVDLLSTNLLAHRNMIIKVCQEARSEGDLEQVFRKLQKGWEETHFRLANFLLTVRQDEEAHPEPSSRRATPDSMEKHRPMAWQFRDSGTFILIGLEEVLSQTHGSIMTLSSMLLSPHAVEFRQEVELWVQRLQGLEELLDIWKRYQLKWTYLSRMFHEFGVITQAPELYQRFLPVDGAYRAMIETMSRDPQVLNFVQLGHGQPGLRALLMEGLAAMEEISAQLLHLLSGPRDRFPRLCFLSDGEVEELLSLHPAPSSLLPLVRKCFQGVRDLELAYRVQESPEEEEDLPSTQPWARGVFGGLGERVPFPSPVEPSLDPLAWLQQLEQQLHHALVQLMADCAVARKRCWGEQGGKEMRRDQVQCREGDPKIRDTLSPDPQHRCVLSNSSVEDGLKDSRESPRSPSLWDLISSFPLQCLLVVEEALWCEEVRRAYLCPAPAKHALLKGHYDTKLQSLCQLIRDVSLGRSEKSAGSRRAASALRAMTILSIKHSQQLSGLKELKCELESSFEWQILMKYHLSVDDRSGPGLSLTEAPVNNDSMEVSCYVDILSSRFPYGYELLSPECWTEVHTTSSDRAALGILLALSCYRFGFVSGIQMSGKTETVVQLGQALGRLVITLRCHPETSVAVVRRMLTGALQTGAWLLLDSADSMSQGALSLLGQHLSDIHHHFSFLQGHNQEQSGKCELKQTATAIPKDSSKGSTESVELRITLGGRTVPTKRGYGCILLSSSRLAIEVPENLRIATRLVSLVQPDYGVIAEATLAASGFSEAASMSRRLVSLLSLASDLVCLPESVSTGSTYGLVLLTRVLTFAGIHLNQSMRVEWEKDKVLQGDQDAQMQLLHMVLRAPDWMGIGPKGTRLAKYRRANQCVIVLQAIAEEQAVIKAVRLAVVSAIIDPGKACHFRAIFEEIFPGASCPPYCLQGREETQQKALKAAIVEELQENGLQPSPNALSTALALYQAMKLSRAVVLLGQAGSGKTTCHRALAGALRRLAGRAEEDGPAGRSSEAAGGTGMGALSPYPAWSSVDTLVIFPNALSMELLWGSFSEPPGCWQDGVITKALRESQELSSSRYHPQRSKEQAGRLHTTNWLVLDGEPLGRPSWLDPLCTLCDPKDPFLCLPMGEMLRPPLQEHGELKILVETTGLEDASPAVVARCGLVLHSAEELWRAVWKAELEAFSRDPGLEPHCLRTWSRLADDLFARTLSFLGEQRLAPVLPEPGVGAREVMHGVQEVMSFSRVLCALEEQFGSNRLKTASKHIDREEGTSYASREASSNLATPSSQQELHTRNVFVVAYIWGFGGHLHPSHWPRFDEFARHALYESRSRVVVPAEASVFDYFVHLSDGPLGTHSGLQNRSLQMSCSTIPLYERYMFLLRLMLKARQPAMLVGEPGSGKTTLCHSVLGPRVPHLRLPASALLRVAHLRALLEGMGCHSVRSDAMATTTRQPGLLLFLDDLHDAPCDAYGKASMALETLRQCMTTGGVLTSSGRHFRLCSSGTLSFLASCASPGEGVSNCGGLSPRLSRLFSVLVLPDLSEPLLFSIHSPRLKFWLSKLPLVADMHDCILAATVDLYRAMRLGFPSRVDRPHFLFSPHDLRKVFQGMCLWKPPWGGGAPHAQAYCSSRSSFTAAMLAVVRLWAHECLRTFWDRLCSEKEREEVLALLTQVSHRNFASRLASVPKTDDKEGESGTPNPSAAHVPGEGEEETMSLREESPVSTLKEKEDEDHTETGEQGSSSLVSSLSEQDALSEILSEEPDLESVNSGDTGTLSSPDTLVETSRTPSTVHPSPRKVARPQSEPDRRSRKLVVRLPQCTSADHAAQLEQSLASARAPVEPYFDLGASLLDLVFGPELSEPLHLYARLHNFNRDSTYKEQELEGLVTQLAAVVKLKEEGEGEGKDRQGACYGVHRQGVRQLVRILRTLLLPGGHGVLLGAAMGTGRKTAVRLATRLTGCRLLEVHSGNETAMWDMLKEASTHAGVQREGLVLLVHESASQELREELLVAMGNRTFPLLCSYKEWKISSLGQGSHRQEVDHMMERYFQQVPWNVHVFLLMPLAPGGECPGVRGFMARALSLCSCVEVYQPWTTECLTDVAAHHLKSYLQIPNVNTEVDGPCLMLSLSQAMAGIHQSAQRYASVLTPDLWPFGPQNFMEFLSHFLFICERLYDAGRKQANRVAAILGRMKELTEQADQYSQEVSRLSNEFTKAQKWQAQLERAVEASRAECERARQKCLLEQMQLAQLEMQLQEAWKLSQDALQQVSPLYQAALEAMQSLSQSDLEELRRYRRPPESVMAVMGVVCVLFGRPCTWESCQKLLGTPNFLQELEFYNHSALSGERLAALSAAVEQPGFRPEAVRGVSRACESLCLWARAVHRCALARRAQAPHEARQARLEADAARARARLRDARLYEEEEARAALETAERRLAVVRCQAEGLGAQLRRAEGRERDAVAAVQQVAPHMADWSSLARDTDRDIKAVPGDALRVAATLAYLGPFGPDVRLELLGKWRDLCLMGHIEPDPEDPRMAHVSPPSRPASLAPPFVPVPLGENLQARVGRLMGGVEGVASGMAQNVPPALLQNLLLWGYKNCIAQHCPLLADVQQQVGIATLPSLGQHSRGMGQAQGQKEFDLEISADDPELLDKLGEGSEKGLTVLVTHVERARPTPRLLRLLGHRARSPPEVPPISPHPGFSLFLSTPLPVRALLREIHPSILAEVQVVDLSLSGAELQELMLAETMQSKCPQAWSQYCQTRIEKQLLLDRLHQQEASLMEYVLQSPSPLLEDPQLLPRVSACRAAASGLRTELLELDRELERQGPLLAHFRVEAEPLAAFYGALQDVSCLCSLYCFPLPRYLLALREALALRQAPDLTFGGEVGMGLGLGVGEGSGTDVVSAEVLVAHLMAHYEPCLFQSHAGVLRLLVAMAMSHHGEGCYEAERVAFLRGLADKDFPGSAQPVPVPPMPLTQLPDWIPPTIQTEVLRLESLPSFKGLVSSLASSPGQWAEYLRYPSSTVIGPVPCSSHSHLSVLQRALLWKTLLPHCLAAVADDLAACHLGKAFQSPSDSGTYTGTPEALSKILGKTERPVVLILPDPTESGPPSLHPLHWVDQAAQGLGEDGRVKNVQVITFGAKCQREVILKALDLAVLEGHWLVFNNCHLLDQWDEEVVRRVTQILSSTDGARDLEIGAGPARAGPCGQTPAHRRFRLWFITRGNAPLSIPAVVRSSASRLACNSPWGLKEALRCSLRQAAMAVTDPAVAGPVLRCAVLHAVLLQRSTYGRLGQRREYCWTCEDLQALLEAQVWTTRHCIDPVGALEYIAGSLVYGGHVEDPADLEAVKAVAGACLRPPPQLWGRSPNTLSALVAHGRFGRRGLLQEVERRLQASSPSADPLLLGLGAGLAVDLLRRRSHTVRLLLRDSQTAGVRPHRPAPPPHRPALPPHCPASPPHRPALPPQLPDAARDRLRMLRDMPERAGGHRVTPRTPLGLFLQREWDDLQRSADSLRVTLAQDDGNRSPRPALCPLSRLEARAELLGAYLRKEESPETPPHAYRLAAFRSPRGFLAAVMREAAQAGQGDPSRLSLHFQVLGAGMVPPSAPPTGAYLCGLELRGALWDTRLSALQDTLSTKPCPLPLIWVTAWSGPPASPGGASSSLPIYHCPLYLDGEFGEGDVVTSIPLPAKLDPVLCALRPVRLVSTLQ